jgi:hypothetical protein
MCASQAGSSQTGGECFWGNRQSKLTSDFRVSKSPIQDRTGLSKVKCPHVLDFAKAQRSIVCDLNSPRVAGKSSILSVLPFLLLCQC